MEWLKDRRYRTGDAWKGVGASVLLHVAAAALVLLATSIVPQTRAPRVVDLTLEGPETGMAQAPQGEGRRATTPARREPLFPAPSPASTATPVPAATPDPLPPDRQAVAATPRPPGPGGGTERTAALHLSGAVSDAPAFAALPSAGLPHAAFRGASTVRGATAAGADAEGPGEARAQPRAPYLEREYAYIRDAIQRGIAYPAMARRMGWEGKVVVSFLVLSDGSVRDVRVVQGSGHPALDRGAVDAVRKAAPFPRPPAEAEIITPVVYRLE